MAVYKHNYQAYTGPLTNLSYRFLVLPKYAYERVFGSKLFTLLIIIALLPPVGGAILIYLQHNAKALQILQVPVDELIAIDATFFQVLLWIQSSFAFVITTLIGPGLISPDLTNNALPLYLSRPLTRRDYVIGKMSVLVILLSAVTWVPLSLLYLFESGLEGFGWFVSHLRLEMAILVGSGLCILVVSLLALALSAWVKWRPVAGALLSGVFLVGAGFGAAANEILYTRWGSLMNIISTLNTTWSWLFTGETSTDTVPTWSAFAGLCAVCGVCLLLLARKLKAYEVVRS